MSDASGDSGRRHVAVPLSIFKIVTVFTTFIAVGAIILGFVLIDRGTDRAQAAPEDVDIFITGAGVVLILLAAIMYAFSTRFTPQERANDKGTSAESEDNDG